MLKYILSLCLGVLLLQAADAQRDTTIYYFKNSGETVPVKDSADFYRVILPPDTNVQNGLFRIYDHYPNGKIKMTATSISSAIKVPLEGLCIDYYPTGIRKMTTLFKNGRQVDSMVYYYPNGKLYTILNLEDMGFGGDSDFYRSYFPEVYYHNKIRIKELRDSLGNLLVENGNGHAVIYNDDFRKIVIQGDLKNYKKEADWTGPIGDTGKFVCTYHKDDLKSGASYTNSGRRYTFKQIYVKAVFTDGADEFYPYIKRNAQYPESAKRDKITGTVTVEFYVETDGRVADVKVIRSISKSLDDEAVRVVSSSPLWITAYKYGVPIRSRNTAWVNFY